MLCARVQGSVGRAAYFGVYNTNTHVGGQLIAAATVVRSAPSYRRTVRVAAAVTTATAATTATTTTATATATTARLCWRLRL